MRASLEAALRTLAALPLDQWDDDTWASFEAAQDVVADELGRIDRRRTDG